MVVVFIITAVFVADLMALAMALALALALLQLTAANTPLPTVLSQVMELEV